MTKKERVRYASGLSVADILDSAISTIKALPLIAQREITSRLISAANKRVKNLEKAGVETPALTRLYQSGEKLSVRGKSGEGLLKEFIRARDFLKAKTSSLKEWRKIEKKLDESFTQKFVEPNAPTVNKRDTIDTSNEENKPKNKVSIAQLFNIFDDIREYDGTLANIVPSKDLLARMYDLANDGYEEDEIFQKMVDWLMGKYTDLQNDEMNYSSRFSHGMGE